MRRESQFEGVAVLVPAYNEAAHIGPCLDEVAQAFPGARVLVIDNNSTDDTRRIALACGAEVLCEMRQGKGFAVTSGIRYALAQGAQWIALHDADQEYSAAHLAELVRQCQTEAADGTAPLIMGVGLREVMLGQVLWRSLLANFVAKQAIRLSAGAAPPEDILTGARVMSAALATQLFQDSAQDQPFRGFELETAVTRKAMELGACIVSRRVQYTPRVAAEKKVRAWDMFGIVKAAFNG